jgi:DNA repair protein RecO (recombination protein O)
MSYQFHKTEGIVLASWPRGEHDRTLWLYTKLYGGVTLVAKGIRLEKSKLRGAVGLLCRTSVGFVVGKETCRLTHAELLHAYPVLCENWEQYRAANYIAGVLRHAVVDREPDDNLWTLLQEVFLFLDSSTCVETHVLPLLYSFELRLLKCLGYLPNELPLAVCQLMNGPFFSSKTLSYSTLSEVAMFLQPLRQYAALRMDRNVYIMEK